jgi:DNA repair protein RecN (Recombination protein N)
VTHLPQVAAHADAHVRIEKAESNGRTRAAASALDTGEARAHELARMLSGAEVSQEAILAAQALLRSAAKPARPTPAPRQSRSQPRKKRKRNQIATATARDA